LTQKINAQIDACFKSLEIFSDVIVRRDWKRLQRVRAAFEESLTQLAEALSTVEAANDSVNERVQLLEIQIRRNQRYLAQQMNQVREDLATIDSGIRKIHDTRKKLKT